jgi:peptide-methionine (S)-S-oxide reductase
MGEQMRIRKTRLTHLVDRTSALELHGSGLYRFRSLAGLLVFCLIAAAASAADGPIPPFAGTPPSAASKGKQTAVLAGGCFWGVDAVFKHVKGVESVVAGYAGGSAATAHYEVVSAGGTGHAESVKITFDAGKIAYSDLLRIFFSVAHDPTELNRQGPDTGTQYRSVIFYANDEQKQIALAYIAQLNNAKVFRKPIVTQVVPLKAFYPAEGYHQNFLALHPDNPYIVFNDLPKLQKLRKQFPALSRP